MVYLAHAKPPKRILTGRYRASAISQISSILENYRLSKFEAEGEIRASVRSAMCLSGHPWPSSDSESAHLLAEAFTALGAIRPTWLEGQAEFVLPRERCLRCERDLSAETIDARDRFCSEECRTGMRRYREDLVQVVEMQRYKHAHYRTMRSRAAERECLQCGEAFRSPFATAKYCCHECSNIGRHKAHRTRQCAHCGVHFANKGSLAVPQKYCSLRCRDACRPKRELQCLQCGELFLSSHPKARCCSHRCANKLAKAKRRRAPVSTPAVVLVFPLTPMVFDEVFARAA